jgi:hypothetical protein
LVTFPQQFNATDDAPSICESGAACFDCHANGHNRLDAHRRRHPAE